MLPPERVPARAGLVVGSRKHQRPHSAQTTRQLPSCSPPLLLACLLLACHAVSESRQDEVQSTTNQHININNQQETIKSGNTKTSNFNLQETNYQPTQSTQLVFNVGKYKNTAANKLRRSRPPTIDEFEIKKRIMDVYSFALEDFHAGQRESVHLEHLGRILKALNPKYISTRRLAYVAFADPRDPDAEQVAPESELPPPTEDIEPSGGGEQSVTAAMLQEPLVLKGDSELSLQEQLDLMSDRVRAAVVWDRDFVRKLFRVPDGDFTSNQLAYKRFLQCMTYPVFCKRQMIVKKKQADDGELPSVGANGDIDELLAAAESQPRGVIYQPGDDLYDSRESSPRDEQPFGVVNGPLSRPQQQQQQQQQEWQYQQPPPALQQATAQQHLRVHPNWRKPAVAPPPPAQQQQQPSRRYREQQQVNYQMINPDANLPQKLVQQYAPEYQEQMRRMNRVRGGGHHRHHK